MREVQSAASRDEELAEADVACRRVERQQQVADEKAQAEDQREILLVYAKRYRELTEVAGSVSAELSSCIGRRR